MPNITSAKKMVRKIKRRTLRNSMLKSRYKTSIRKVENAIVGGDKETALTVYRQMQPILHKTASKNAVHIKRVSRKLSSLSKKIKSMPGEFIV